MMKILLVSISVFFMCCNKVSAQDTPSPSIYTQQYDYTSAYLLPQNSGVRPDPSPQAIYNQSSPTAAPQSLTFTPSTSQRKKNIADYVANVAKIAPDYAPKLAAEFGDGTVFNQYGQILGSVGLNVNDVGDNLAVWWITAWEAAQGRPVETNPATFVKVKAQVGRILSEKALTAMSNAEKQKYADSLAIQAMILGNQIEQAKANPDLAPQLAAGIKAGAKKMGFDLEDVTLTDDGFVEAKSRKTGDATDAAKGANPAAAPTAVAAKDGQGTPAKDSAPTYMLLAAIGGASLGGVFLLGKAMGKKG